MARPIDRVSGYGTCGLQTYLRLSVTELRRSFITPREVNSGYGTGGKTRSTNKPETIFDRTQKVVYTI